MNPQAIVTLARDLEQIPRDVNLTPRQAQLLHEAAVVLRTLLAAPIAHGGTGRKERR